MSCSARHAGDSAKEPPLPKSASDPTSPTIAKFIENCVTDAAGATPYDVTELTRAVAALVHWYLRTPGTPTLERAEVFSRPVIVEHIATGLPSFGHATRTNRRSQLLRVAEALLPAELAPRPLPTMAPSDPTAPYTSDEVASLTRWAKAEKRKGHGADALVLLALGFGVGLSAVEVMSVRAAGVSRHDGAVLIQVTEGRIRTVPVLRQWESVVADRAAELEANAFLFKPGRAGAGKNLISNFVARANPDGVHAQTQRMRSTWLATQMSAGTGLPELVDAAGVDSLEALTRYLPFVRRLSAEHTVAQLRRAA
ncbi:MAG: hypothetical protein JWM49_2525 [Microbacteriaceae bacterium]|nr:hypothetical protein [Microbacteriaceae bacterium]